MSKYNLFLSTLKQKGNLAYEYHPLHNYQIDSDLYEIDTAIGKVLVPYGCAVDKNTGEILKHLVVETDGSKYWLNKNKEVVTEYIRWDDNDNSELYATAGSLLDLDTDKLNFDLEHPVDIEIQPSYDGSVNLILNDDKNIPRLINSRFSPREKSTYEIVDRIGENDTNIYNSKTFEKDTALYYQYEKNPEIKYLGLTNGYLPVGNYCIYLTYCDADDNESDFVVESGLIPVFIGNDKDPSSMDGGIKNQDSNKGIRLQILNLDKSYNYLKIYYFRYFADYQQNRVYEFKKIINKVPINTSYLNYVLTGHENTEDIDPNLLNISRFNPSSILTQAQCKNILFFGNIVKNIDNYKELTDCALRIIPSLKEQTIGKVNNHYIDNDNNYSYYNSQNIYNYTGYQNEEYYRFGVVFIYNNGSLSNVYNTLGFNLINNQTLKNQDGKFLIQESGVYLRNYIPINDNGWISNSEEYYSYSKGGGIKNINSRGVCKIEYSGTGLTVDKVLGITFSIPEEVVKFLKEELGIRGLFFVRQKCYPTILGQCYLLPMDKELQAPCIKIRDKDNEIQYISESFIGQYGDYDLEETYEKRLIKINNTKDNENKDIPNDYINYRAYAAICPDFLLNQPYYNQIFNGNSFYIGAVCNKELTQQNKERLYYIDSSSLSFEIPKYLSNVRICSVTENVKTVAIEDCIYRLEVGKTEEAYRYRFFGKDNSTFNTDDENGANNAFEAKNLVRGNYSPYLAIYSTSSLNTDCIYNIYAEKNSNVNQQYLDRMNSTDPYYAIDDRHNFEQLVLLNKEYSETCFRGDSYVNTFTYRLNRNFNDPSLPNNDKIIDSGTWNKYVTDTDGGHDVKKIIRSDVNAVRLGSWITIPFRGHVNYALRSVDHSYVSEEAMMGAPRSFYPRSKLKERGENKMPDSYLYNDAFRASLGFKCYFTIENTNYMKNDFSNRIQYSAISIQDSFKNNYRESLSTYFRDYSQEYGGITRLIGFEGYLLVVFEHGIGIAVINERILAGQGDGNPVFINTQNVLPEELTIITDTYGSQWSESIVKSESGAVYGVDTVAKKIWRVKGQQIEILSDFKVNSFLNNNITLEERELYPIIGLKNVKSHYNNNKKDIMFTFYDDVYKDEEKVWNLCYNEMLDQFITFYSWVPSYSENIDTQFFTFDRNTSKYLTLLWKSNYSIKTNYGVLVDPSVYDDVSDGKRETNPVFNLKYRVETPSARGYVLNNEGTSIYRTETFSTLANENGEIPGIQFKIEKDHWGMWKYVTYNSGGNFYILQREVFTKEHPIVLLEVTPYITDNFGSSTYFPTETIALTLRSIVENQALTKEQKEETNLTTDFYLHGNAGIIDIKEDLYPTYWYGEFHPFEFEFIVNDKIGYNKIFSNLMIVSNKAEPESFHFEIEGDGYEFSKDKRAMYFRQESTKEMFQNMGSNIIFDRKYTDVVAKKLTQEQYYRSKNYTENYNKLDKVYPVYEEGLVQQVKSTLFPLYYNRIDTYNQIYDSYTGMNGYDTYDFKNLSGSEIIWDRTLNQFNIVTHIKNSPINIYGRTRGNSHYKDGKWNVQIPSIIYMQKNESKWPLSKDINVPPIVINQIPNDIDTSETITISSDVIPNIYNANNSNIYKYVGIKNDGWTQRKETRIRDKWIKIKIRYSGKNLAVIHSLITLYNNI